MLEMEDKSVNSEKGKKKDTDLDELDWSKLMRWCIIKNIKEIWDMMRYDE